MTANKRIHIISTYFLAAASDKRMRLFTSLNSKTVQYKTLPYIFFYIQDM